jgi:peroxiredoxin
MLKKFNLILLLFSFFSLNSIYACDKNQAGGDNKPESKPTVMEHISNVYSIGDMIENFTLNSPDGKSISIYDFNESKARVLIFWSVQCPVVQAYSERTVNLFNEYKDKGIEVILIYPNSTESLDDIKDHISERNYAMTVLIDENQKVTDQFGATKTPEVYIIDQKNILVYKGRIDDSQNESKVTSSDLKAALDDILEGREIAVSETKAFGCAIKR